MEMQWLARVRSWVRAVVHRGRLEAEMETELANHLEARAADLIRAGLSPDEAARRARIELGPALMHKEGMRASVGLRWWDELASDLRYATRMLRKNPGFTWIAATSLALAIGANTTIFSFAEQMLYERLAVPHATELRLLAWSGTEDHVAVHSVWGDWDKLQDGRVTSTVFSYRVYRELRAANHVLNDLIAFKETGMNVTIRDEATRMQIEITTPQRRYPPGTDVAFHRRLELAIAALPGVESVAAAWVSYVGDDRDMTDFLPEGENYREHGNQAEFYNVVGNRFFETLGVPIVAGRGFGPEDTATSAKVAVINQALARKRFPGIDPIGRRFRTETDEHGNTPADKWIRIVGVCGDTRYANLRDEPPQQFTLPFVQQASVGAMTHEIRTRMMPTAILPALRGIVRKEDPDLPLVDVRTEEQQIDAALQQERLFVTLTSGFGALALALAAVGIYGVMAYSVAQRTSEMGIRLALGAKPVQLRGMILRESTEIAAVGIVVGLGCAIALTRLIKSMLYGIRANDSLTLAAGVALLLLVALLSSWIPARRAARGCSRWKH